MKAFLLAVVAAVVIAVVWAGVLNQVQEPVSEAFATRASASSCGAAMPAPWPGTRRRGLSRSPFEPFAAVVDISTRGRSSEVAQ